MESWPSKCLLNGEIFLGEKQWKEIFEQHTP